MPGISVQTTHSKGGTASTDQLKITVDGDDQIHFTDLRFELGVSEAIKAVGTVYVDLLDVQDMDGRLECDIAGERCVIVPIREIEERAGHPVFARAFRKILGLT